MGEVMVFEDSQLIIQAMNGENHCRNLRLVRLINKINSFSKSFRQIEFFHILHELNAMAYHAGNNSMVVGRNELYVNPLLSIGFPP